jgi:hypothetical protein
LKPIKSTIARLTFVTGLIAPQLLCAQPHPPAKPAASTIEVKMVQPGEISLPAEFQVALYEDLIQELQKKGGFSQVYRDGDRNAAGAPGLVILNATVTGFKKGSEMERDVTTVAGATSITVDCKFTGKDGAVLLESNIVGKVRFIGDNLKATDDFAKKAATLARKSLSSGNKESDVEIPI